MKPLILFYLILCTCVVLNTAVFAASETGFDPDGAVLSEPLSLEIEELDAETLFKVTDGDYYSFFSFDSAELTVIPEKPALALYIVWNEPPEEYTVMAEGTQIKVTDGFLHRFMTFSEPSGEIKINAPYGGKICDIYLFSDTENLPDYVQDWREPCKQADLLVFSAHADDELLMFGGTLPYYAGELDLRVQVVYMTTHWEEQPRPHEMLDGLWTAGVENYPVLGIIPDIPYQPIFTLSEAAELYDFEEISRWFTKQIRRFKPSVIVTHDLKGEYGHAAHKLAAKTASEAVELAGDPDIYPGSAEIYGVWDVPKIYLHFYPENTLEMDWERPLESFGGITAREAAALCYDKHRSQHVWGYSVWYKEKWDCRQFGLYRSLVGEDKEADFMDNITPLVIEEPSETTETVPETEASEEITETLTEETSQVPQNTEIKPETEPVTEAQNASPHSANCAMILTAAAIIIISAAIIILIARHKRKKR